MARATRRLHYSRQHLLVQRVAQVGPFVPACCGTHYRRLSWAPAASRGSSRDWLKKRLDKVKHFEKTAPRPSKQSELEKKNLTDKIAQRRQHPENINLWSHQ